ncbi:MAG: efflux RND transporter periplasmic adaptor subunit [Patescibacteria group bacterium]
MKKLLKKWWFWLIIILVVLIVLFSIKALNKKDKVTYVTEIAKVQDLVQTVEVTGQVESADDINLNFLTTGTLQEVPVKVGDQVKAEQVLARLQGGDLASQVNNARAALDIAQSDLDQLLAGASAEDIAVTEKQVATAQTTYNTAKDTLANLEKTRDQAMADLRTTGLNTLNDKYFIVKYALDVVYDTILDSTADSYLYVNDTSLLNNAKTKYQIAKANYQLIGPMVDTVRASNNQEDILRALDAMRDNLQETSDVLTLTFNVLLSALTNSTYTEAVISTMKTSINTQSTAVNTGLSAVQTAASNLRTQDLSYKNQVIAANNSIQSALDSLNLAQAQLDLKKAPARSFDIAAAQARVRQAQASLDRAYSDFGDTIIKAPVDGIITQVNFAKGEQSSLTQPIIAMIGLSNLQIEVDVPESDVTKIKVSDPVDIDINAFNDNTKFKGVVTFIDPASTVINGVTYYKIKVVFNEKDERIKAGMTADLTILTASRPQVLVVPSRAVITRDDKHHVQVLLEGKPVDKEVSIGLKGDNSLIEISSGLNDGEAVIVSTKSGS